MDLVVFDQIVQVCQTGRQTISELHKLCNGAINLLELLNKLKLGATQPVRSINVFPLFTSSVRDLELYH